jgi:predicted ATPase/DNA-binding SARP family transcriptional activator
VSPSTAQTVARLGGGLAIEIGGRSVGHLVPPGQATLVLAYLMLHRAQPVRREELIEALWPDAGPRDPQAVLSTLLSRLRRALAPASIEGKSELRLVMPEPAWVDVEVARAAVDDALRAQDSGDWVSAHERAREALEFTELELLPGFDNAWLDEQRRELDDLGAIALESVARSAVTGRGASLAEGRRAAQALVSKAPFRETGYRLLMEVLEAGGDVAEALQVYDDLRTVLRDELGAGPAANVQALHRRLLEGGRQRAAGAPEAGQRLPEPRTSFVGREREAGDLRRIALSARGATIVGAGGMGKTRLALHVAGQLDVRLAEGSWMVELAALEDGGLVPSAVASALGVREEADRLVTETLARALAARELLIVLDNCEHVLAAARSLADALIGACPRLIIIATSRESLGYAGESVLVLHPLSTPAGDGMESAAASDAVELFRQRAAAATGDFRLTDRNAGAVARICRSLDGMPLALELAAALVAALGVREIDERLDDRLRLTMTAALDAPDRHRTLGALVDWSHDLLDVPERSLFRRLAVFRGGFTLTAAERVCEGLDETDQSVIAVLPRLVRKSLVVKEEAGERARYRMLETIRQYAALQLERSGEGPALGLAHLRYFRELAEQAEPVLADGELQVEALDRLEAELDNFREALNVGTTLEGDHEAAVATAGALFTLWYVRGHMTEGRRWLDLCIAACGDAEPAYRAKALAANGELAREQGDYPSARAFLSQSLEIARELGIATGYGGSAFSLFNLGCVAWEEGEYVEARRLLEESLELVSDPGVGEAGFDRAWPMLKLGQVALDERDAERAASLFEESLSRHRKLGDREGLARALEQLARAALMRGDARASRLLSERSLEAAAELGYKEGLAGPLVNLARVALADGDHEAARTAGREALAVTDQLGSKRGVAAAIETLARTYAVAGDCERALQLFGAASAIRAEIGSPVPGHLRDELNEAVERARAAATGEMAGAAWAVGVAMTREAAVALAAN